MIFKFLKLIINKITFDFSDILDELEDKDLNK